MATSHRNARSWPAETWTCRVGSEAFWPWLNRPAFGLTRSPRRSAEPALDRRDAALRSCGCAAAANGHARRDAGDPRPAPRGARSDLFRRRTWLRARARRWQEEDG